MDESTFVYSLSVEQRKAYHLLKLEARKKALDDAINAAKNCLHEAPTYQQDDLLTDVVSAITTLRDKL